MSLFFIAQSFFKKINTHTHTLQPKDTAVKERKSKNPKISEGENKERSQAGGTGTRRKKRKRGREGKEEKKEAGMEEGRETTSLTPEGKMPTI